MAETEKETLVGWSQRLKHSDRSAFSALFSALYPSLLWYARRLAGDEDTASDIVQDAFIRLWDRRTSIDPRRSVQAFLYITVRNLTHNHERNTRTRQALLESMNEPGKPPGPDETLNVRLLGQHLRQWMDELPDRRREAFELSRFCGLTHHEIASVMGLSTHTVDKHITHALKQLRQRLGALDPDRLRTSTTHD